MFIHSFIDSSQIDVTVSQGNEGGRCYLAAIASEYNRNHASLRLIINCFFAEVNATSDLVAGVTLRTKRATVRVRLEQSTMHHTSTCINYISVYQMQSQWFGGSIPTVT